ncbi:MAG: DUF362 domain-containing protein [Eubacterium sp.]|nr:DUF362 domain-containing protein [Eubacterium sp.]
MSKVVVLNCPGYDPSEVYEKVQKGLSLLGGAEKFFDPDKKILLKPNLLRGAKPERAITAHPAVCEAVIRTASECECRDVSIGDSCGVGFSVAVMKEMGLGESCRKYGVTMAGFKEDVYVENKQGVHAKGFHLAKEVVDADEIISICKMKTHALEYITGAVKNQYGCIQGMHKAQGHTIYTSQVSFAKMLVELNLLIKPRLFIMDGITAMEGNGPASGDPVDMKVLLLSEDPVALDTVFCRLIHLDPDTVPTVTFGESMGLGTASSDKIEILTEEGTRSIEEIVSAYGNPSFKVERRKQKASGLMSLATNLRFLKRKPKIIAEKCRKCGVCVEACPVEGKALTFKNGRGEPPVYDYKKCIRCFCCQEMCPHKAIQVKGKG